MNVPATIKQERAQELLVVAKLAVAFTVLADVPFDSWGHEGDPAEMAVLAVLDSKKRGHFGFLQSIVLGNYGRYS